MMLLCIFAAYNGLVLYVIYATGHPFDSPVAVDPAPFKAVFGNTWQRQGTLGRSCAPAPPMAEPRCPQGQLKSRLRRRK